MVRGGADFYLMLHAACYEPHAAACGSVFVLPCRLCAVTHASARWAHAKVVTFATVSDFLECGMRACAAQGANAQFAAVHGR